MHFPLLCVIIYEVSNSAMRIPHTIFAIAFLSILQFHVVGQSLYINEVMADNTDGEMDAFFQTDDWVEIYNDGGVMNLGGYYFSDDPDTLYKWQIPANDPTATFMLPGSYKIFWFDRDPEQGATHVDFSLSADGEVLFLTAPDGETIIDSITFGPQGPNVSYGRSCDACSDWVFFNTPTFNTTNVYIPPTDALVFINEVQNNNTDTYHDLTFEYDPWIEIYNPNTTQVNLAGFELMINGQSWSFPVDDPSRTVISSNGFGIFWLDGDSNQGSHHSSILLAAGAGTISIKGPSGSVIDVVNFPSINTNQSYGRQNDGAINWIPFNTPTPAVSNTTIPVSSPLLYINELLPANQTDTIDNYGGHSDWFEIYNPNNFEVYLGGYYISDNLENPTKWRVPVDFPDSVVVPANDWLLFWADGNTDQGVRHASYSLSNNGEYLGLFTPDGFTVVDEVVWNHVDPDTSYGRITDGAAEWWLFITTTPERTNSGGVLGIPRVETTLDDTAVYPNPFTNEIRFHRMSNGAILDVSGKIIAQFSQQWAVDTSRFPSGLYLIRLDDGSIKKAVKH
jgi:hypothetical protein